LWSPRSIDSATISDEVTFARGKSKVIHVTMQNTTLPEAFRGDKAVNLTGWRGEDDFAPWRELAGLVTERAGVKPLPPPAPRPPSGFFQPGVVRETAGASAASAGGARSGQPPRSQPAPRAEPPRQAPPRPQPAPRSPAPVAEREASGGGRGMIIGAFAFLVVAVAGGAGYYFWNQSQNQATTTAWDAVSQNDPDALRAFLAGDPGEFRDEAQQALRQLEERSYEAASDADTIDAFENFLNDFPDSEHAIAARGRIAELQTITPTEGETIDPALAPPTGEPVDPDLVPPGTTGAAPAEPGAGPAPIAPPPADPAPAPAGPTN